MPSARNRMLNVASVAIIGAGPSGLAAAKYLLAERAFDRIVIFEQRAKVGGLWDYADGSQKRARSVPIPQTDPQYDMLAVKSPGQVLSPLYDHLETNIPKNLMGFSDLAWPKDSQLFPKHETVLEYLETYADEVKHLIRFKTKILKVERNGSESSEHAWRVTSTTASDQSIDEDFDAVVAASGHFNVPFIPPMVGLQERTTQHPSTVSHSMLFKSAEEFRDKKVLLIGNGASGVDIASHVTSACKWPLLHSQRSESFLLSDPSPSRHILPDVKRFISDTRSVEFADGHIESNIDHILFCTGYFYSFPYMDLQPPLINEGTYVQNLYQHLFYRHDPTLVMPVLQQRVIPFPMAEVQAAVYARVWSGRLTLPSDEAMQAWERERDEASGGGRNFHILKFPEDADYINMMHDLAMSVDEPSKGKTPPRWGEKEYWLRERFPMVKKAYNDRGEGRGKVKTIEELGFDYEAWKREQDVENKTLI